MVVAAAATAIAVVAALGSLDARSWDRALDDGDGTYEQVPQRARWEADGRLPGDPVGQALAIDADLAFRRGLRAFVVAERTPRGFDNGERRAEARARAAGALVDVASGGDAPVASRAYDLLGVLAATGDELDSEQALDAFEAAVRADDANLDAKYNLELLLRRTRATGLRRGEGGGSGPRGGRGAGAPAGGGGA